MRLLLLGLLVTRAAFGQPTAGIDIGTFPDGSDSIGIPRGVYVSTIYVRCERVDGHVVRCDAMNRGKYVIAGTPGSVAGLGLPIDNAGHCRYAVTDPGVPLPDSGWGWSAGSGWCLFVQRTDTGEVLSPAAHCEEYRWGSRSGGADSECWYPDLPAGIPFIYLSTVPATTNVLARTLSTIRVWPKAKGVQATPPSLADGTPAVPGKLPASYRYHHKVRRAH